MFKVGVKFIFCMFLLFTSLSFSFALESSDFANSNSYEDIYFKICADESCEDFGTSYVLSDSKVFIRGYNIEGLDLNLLVIKPSGELFDISFGGFFLRSDVARVSFDGTGEYNGVVTAQKEGEEVFRQRFKFRVFESKPSIISETLPNEGVSCSDAGELVYEGSVSRAFSGDRFNYSKSRDLISSIQEVNMVLQSGDLDNWRCPPTGLGEGIECGEKVNRTVYVSYSPNRDLILCSQPQRKTVSVFGGVLFSNDNGRRSEALENLMEEVRNDFTNFTCASDCNKRMRIAKLRTESPLFGLLGDKYYYDYELRCERESSISDNWNAEIVISEVKSCEEV